MRPCDIAGDGADSDEGEGEEVQQAAEGAASQSLLTLDQAVVQSEVIQVSAFGWLSHWCNTEP